MADLTTIADATLAEVQTDDRGEALVFTVTDPTTGAQQRLTVPRRCTSGAEELELGAVVTLEYRTRDEAAGANCGYQWVAVVQP